MSQEPSRGAPDGPRHRVMNAYGPTDTDTATTFASGAAWTGGGWGDWASVLNTRV